MSREVLWDSIIVEEFRRLAVLTDDEDSVLMRHINNHSRQKIALEMNVSLSTVDRIIKRLKNKYDAVQMYSPILPKRNRIPPQ